MNSFYDFKVSGLGGDGNLLDSLRGKVALVVNVASHCGYTPQYALLQSLYEELKEKNFTVIGFPCNQFGAQEPGTAAQIQSFCSLTYGVNFPLTAKVDVNGAKRAPVYAWLTAPENGYPGDIQWNFEKFLIDPSGRVKGRYPAGTPPTDSGLLQDVADNLA